MKELLLIGNGMSTGRLLDELLKYPVSSEFTITVVGDESEGSYNRTLLSPLLADEIDVDLLIKKPVSWYQQQGIRFIHGVAERVFRENKTVYLVDGQTLEYDHLILATGSRPAKTSSVNQHLDNIYNFRTLKDVLMIANKARVIQHAVVVGGGLAGLEAAYGLILRGANVTLVHRGDYLLNRQLDQQAGEGLRRVLEHHNIRFEMDCEVDSFESTGQVVQRAILTNGKAVSCHLVVIATGITPNKELGEASGLDCGVAIRVNDFMTSSDDSISAIGECCEHAGITFGMVEPIWLQCKILASKLAGKVITRFQMPAVATTLQVSGVDVFSAGDHTTTGAHRTLIFTDPASYVYRKLLLKKDRIVGIVLLGDTRDGQYYFELMQKRVNVSKVADILIFGRDFFDLESLLEANQFDRV